MGECDGKVAFVTGASRGIGRAIAQRFAAEGASVVVCASRLGSHEGLEGTLEQTVEVIQAAGGKAAAIACDLSDPSAREGLVERASSFFGPIDILVNNAAGTHMKLPSQCTTEERSFMFDMNVNGPVDLAQQAIPNMRSKGTGWILNISSATAKQPEVPYRDSKMAAWVIGPYGSTKSALNRYTVALAHEVAEEGIFVNAMAPTSIVLTSGAAYVRDIARNNPDMAEPVEMMAEGALELCTGHHVGRVIFSRDIVHAVNRKVKSVDGKQVLGDAYLEADLESTA
ncbi:MAG: SDR family NAD(P)-dependent oxidoreductase [Myxococcota bacterium]|nr:SDR family NAD(P)-dependent oxidoreductase [Myxococcota bacterium]